MNTAIASFRARVSALFGDALVRQLTSGSLWSLIIKVASAGLTYIMFVLISQSMDASEFGRFGFGFNLGTFLAVVASAGLHTAILRWIPEYNAQGRPDESRQALRWSIAVTVFVGLTLTIIAASAVAALRDIPEKAFIFAGLCLILPVACAELFASALRAKGSVIRSQLPRDVLWRLAGIGVAAIALLRGQPSSAVETLLWLAAILMLFVAPQIVLLRHDLVAKDVPIWPDKVLAWHWSSQLGPYWGISVIYASTQYVDVLLVGAFVTAEDAGAYFAASRTASLCALMLVASNMVSAPLISGAFHSGDKHKLQRILRVVSACISVPTILIVMVLITVGKPLLALFDRSFVSAYPAFIVLAVAHGINGICGPMSYVLQLTGHGRNNLIIIAGSYAVGIAAQLLLIPEFGTIGAAWGSGGAIVLWSMLSWYYCRRYLGIDPTMISLMPFGAANRVGTNE